MSFQLKLLLALPIIFGMLSLALSGCAAPVPTYLLVPRYDFNDQLPNKHYLNSIFVRDVSVNKDFANSYPTMQYQIIDNDLRSALNIALRRANYLSDQESAKYYLDASLEYIKVPGIGLNSTATATIKYTMARKKDSSIIFNESLTLPCTITVGEMFQGDIRARMAVGCAVGENITHLIKTLDRKKEI